MERLNLEPLQQWVCDSCGEVIEKPEHGYVEFKTSRDTSYRDYGFRIVHHALHSPHRKHGGDCYYPNNERGGDMPLTDCLGVRGIVRLTSWVDPGEEFIEDFQEAEVKDLREWVVLLRRLHVPHYEEVRLFFAQAHADGNLGDSNEVYFYSPEGLKEILNKYAGDE